MEGLVLQDSSLDTFLNRKEKNIDENKTILKIVIYLIWQWKTQE